MLSPSLSPSPRKAVLLAVLVLPLAICPAEASPSARVVQRLVAAHKASNAVKLARAAELLGAQGLGRALRHSGADVRSAALAGAALVDDGALVLADIVDLMRRRWADAAEIARAARAVQRIAERLRPRQMRRLGLRPQMVASVARDIARGVRESGKQAHKQAALLGALVQLDEIARLSEPTRLAAIAATHTRAARLAALELFAGRAVGSDAAAAALVRRVRARDDAVARRAAAVLCGGLPRRLSRRAVAKSAAARALAGDREALARVVALVLGAKASAPADELVEISRCLRWRARARDADARRALRALRRRKSLRAALRRLR